MKKTLLAILLLTTICLSTKAQSISPFKKGDNLLNVGIGLGSPFFGSGYSASLPFNPTISFEKGVSDEISVGGQLSYASSKYSFGYFGYDYSFKLNAIYIGARGSYHLNEVFEIDDDRFDIYGGASLGYVIVSVNDNEGYGNAAGSAFGYGAFAGGKYYLKPKMALYAELGYQSLSYLNIGISFKL